MGARMTGVLGDAVAKLTFDSDFQKQRQQQSASLSQGLESFAMVSQLYENLQFIDITAKLV